jgi:putative membrane protein
MHASPALLCVTVITGVMLGYSGIANAAITNGDKQFLIQASQSNVDEIRFSSLAEKKASRPEVKAFAQKMVLDHKALEKKMKPFAMAWSVKQPAALDADHRREYRKLKALSGAAFDKEYMAFMDKDHNQILEAFTHEANVATDPDFKSTVISEKSVVAAHTNMADELKDKL